MQARLANATGIAKNQIGAHILEGREQIAIQIEEAHVEVGQRRGRFVSFFADVYDKAKLPGIFQAFEAAEQAELINIIAGSGSRVISAFQRAVRQACRARKERDIARAAQVTAVVGDAGRLRAVLIPGATGVLGGCHG